MTDTELLQAIYQDTQELKTRVTGIEDRVTGIEDRVTGIEDRVTGIEDRVTGIEDRVTAIEDRVTKIEDRVTGIEDRMNGVEKRVAGIEMTLENETNPNIKVIAEGHLDLSRKLNDALKVENEKEILLIRVNHLENELRKVKEQINQIA